jgi:hypothetical protein
MALSKEMKILVTILIIGLSIAFIPLISLWCINTLFPAAAIAYNFTNWFAAFLLILIFSGGSVSLH